MNPNSSSCSSCSSPLPAYRPIRPLLMVGRKHANIQEKLTYLAVRHPDVGLMVHVDGREPISVGPGHMLEHINRLHGYVMQFTHGQSGYSITNGVDIRMMWERYPGVTILTCVVRPHGETIRSFEKSIRRHMRSMARLALLPTSA